MVWDLNLDDLALPIFSNDIWALSELKNVKICEVLLFYAYYFKTRSHKISLKDTTFHTFLTIVYVGPVVNFVIRVHNKSVNCGFM